MKKSCQRQLLIEYLTRYGRNLPNERMLEVIDMDVMDKFGEEVTKFCEQIKEEFAIKRGEDNNDVLH